VIPTPAIASAVTVPASPVALSPRAELDEDQAFGRRPKRTRKAAAAAFLVGLGAVGIWSAIRAKPAETSKATAASAVTSPPVAVTAPPPTRVEPTAVPDPTPANTEPQAAAQPPSAKTSPSPAPSTEPEAEARPSRASRNPASAPPSPRSAPAGAKAAEAKPEGDQSELGGAATSGKARGAVDDEALQVAIAQASERAKGCRIEGGPTGVAHVSVTFAPSGDVIGANVQGSPFAHTLEGECIAAKFRALHVPAFSGNEVTVRKAVSIQ